MVRRQKPCNPVAAAAPYKVEPLVPRNLQLSGSYRNIFSQAAPKVGSQKTGPADPGLRIEVMQDVALTSTQKKKRRYTRGSTFTKERKTSDSRERTGKQSVGNSTSGSGGGVSADCNSSERSSGSGAAGTPGGCDSKK